MPRLKTALTPAEYAVLGLLRRRPAHGYDLQRQLSGETGIGRVCPVETAMVYAVLKSLAGRGLIAGTWERSEYPPKAVYSVTDEGEAEFGRWLRSPVHRLREVRLDFLLKLYFALMEDAALARDLTAAQLEACIDYAGAVEAELAEAGQGTFEEIVLQSKASAAAATEEWLRLCLRRLS
jgi:PadR family transcriptional regulator AphA